jgi:catechol 2,3-dioxygenase-like lactoylglutathione lyase family enzyme
MTEIVLESAIPFLRIYDVAKAKEFYIDFLGFKLDWEHRFDDNAPFYMQVSRSGLRLHLSEHYGDGTPGTAVYIRGRNIAALAAELNAKGARFARPSPTDTAPKLTDPFGNVLRFDDEISNTFGRSSCARQKHPLDASAHAS